MAFVRRDYDLYNSYRAKRAPISFEEMGAFPLYGPPIRQQPVLSVPQPVMYSQPQPALQMAPYPAMYSAPFPAMRQHSQQPLSIPSPFQGYQPATLGRPMFNDTPMDHSFALPQQQASAVFPAYAPMHQGYPLTSFSPSTAQASVRAPALSHLTQSMATNTPIVRTSPPPSASSSRKSSMDLLVDAVRQEPTHEHTARAFDVSPKESIVEEDEAEADEDIPIAEGKRSSHSSIPSDTSAIALAHDGSSSSNSLQGRSPNKALTYSAIITMAILAMPERKAKIHDIYAYIQSQRSIVPQLPANWKLSVRHNLSSRPCFVRITEGCSARNSWWALDENELTASAKLVSQSQIQ
jgi:hypothetical protein